MEVILLQSDGWEAVYLNGVCEMQGHNLNKSDGLAFLRLAEQYKFKAADVKQLWVTEIDEDYLYIHARFPKQLDELPGWPVTYQEGG